MLSGTTLLVAATELESEGIKTALKATNTEICTRWPLIFGILGTHRVALLITGVGIVRVTAALSTVLAQRTFSQVLQFGFCGAYPKSGLDIGALVLANSECDPQSGIEDPLGFRDLGELGFPITDEFPNYLEINNSWFLYIAKKLEDAVQVKIATVTTCSGTDERVSDMESISGAQVEAMEGFPAAWLTQQLSIPFSELRVVSNTTGDRHKQKWNLPHANQILTKAINDLFSFN